MAKTLNEQAKEIIGIAERAGVQGNFFFRTTFQRYLVQIDNAARLERKLKELSDDRITVTKSYQKNRDNEYVHPLIGEYNKTADSANKTMAALLKIIRQFGATEAALSDGDDLMAAINGGEDYD